ncbi:MAG: hypothetical protein KKA55_01290 [Proteobacteria bacterium]|nr:hypothetical protein [Pseudomonadota bacterium]MBU1594153.1 hypothetical protein [Pseudomonadota bacterium]
MSLAHLIKHVLDGLWAVGGIGAAADLGLEDFESPRGAGRPLAAQGQGATQEGELCTIPCSNCSSRR